MTLGEFITFRREQLGYKKIEFAKILGVGSDSLLSWEKDRFIPAGKNMRALIKYLKFTSEEIRYYFRTDLYG